MRRQRRRKSGKASRLSGKKISGKMIIVICCIIAVIAATVGIWFCTTGEKSEPSANNRENNLNLSENEESQKIGDSEEDEESEDKNSSDRANSSDGADSSDRTNSGNSSGNESGGNVTSADGSDESGRLAITEQDSNTRIEFPYNVSGSNLLIRRIASYDGRFIEDGSDSDVSGVTVMIVENTGKTQIEYALISLNRDGKALQFEVSALPAGEMAVVQESDKVPFQEGNYTACRASVAEVDDFTMSEDKIRVEETGEQEITVTNLTDQEIPAVRIFYKFYMEDENTYVGGITYTAKITNLQAGDSQIIQPSHYLKDSSRIMMARTYDTAE